MYNFTGKAAYAIQTVILLMGLYNDYLGNYEKSQALYLFILAINSMSAIYKYTKDDK